jgi:hypothetical protein
MRSHRAQQESIIKKIRKTKGCLYLILKRSKENEYLERRCA